MEPPSANHIEMVMAAGAVLDGMTIDDYAYYGQWLDLMAVFDEGLDVDALETEFVRLFASGTDHALCPPIETFYVADAESGGIAAVMAELQRVYSGLGLSPLGGESADHISTQLAVLSELCAREAEAWSREDFDEVARHLAHQRLMLGGHVARWIPAFRARMLAANAVGFYPAVIEAMFAFVVHDADWARMLGEGLKVRS
jgi:TorA maturation chaperone TorD